MKPSTAGLFLFTAAVGACTSGKVDIGDNTPLLNASGIGGSPGAVNTSDAGPIVPAHVDPVDFAGTWDGHVDYAMPPTIAIGQWDPPTYQWNDGTNRIRVTLDAQGRGLLEVGDAAPLPPPASPDEAYPVGVPPQSDNQPVQFLIAGFSYPIADGTEQTTNQAKRLRLTTSTEEVYRQWCSLQAPVPTTDGSYRTVYMCLPNVGFEMTGCSSQTDECTACYLPGAQGKKTPVACGKLPCLTACTCDKSACTIGTDGSTERNNVQLVATLGPSGNDLMGTLQTGNDQLVLQMTRQP